MAPHRRRTRTILGDGDPVQHQEATVSRSSADGERRLPKTRPPYYVKSSATSSECDWDDDITDVPDVDVRESLDESGDGRVVHCADLRKSETTEEPPRPREEPFREERSDAADARQVGSASRVRVVRVPVYSVAGRRVSVRELLREKTRSMARSSDGARRLLRRVAGAVGDGRVGGATIAAILRSFNVASDADVVDAALAELDRGADGRVALAEFVEWALPDESCAATDVGPGTKSGARRPATARVRLEEPPALAEKKKTPTETFASSFSKPLSARDAERLLRRKIREKFRDDGRSVRRAFRSFDVDGDGFLDEREFFAALDRFHVAVAPEEREKIFAAFAGDGLRGENERGARERTPRRVSADAFLEAFGAPERVWCHPPDATDGRTRGNEVDVAEAARADASARFADGERRLEAAFARARRVAARTPLSSAARASRDARARGVRAPERSPEPALTLLEARAALGKEGDPALCRKLKAASDERADRLVTRSAARAVCARHAAGVADVAAKEATRDFDDGFGRELCTLQATRGSTIGGATSRGAPREAPAVAVHPELAFRDGFGPRGGPRAVASIEAALREKLEARGVSGERAFRLLFDLENRGWVDRAALARVLHRFNIPASEAEVDALVARYDASGDGARICAKDFCERLLAPDFPTAAEKAKRRADGVVSAFRRAFKDDMAHRTGVDVEDVFSEEATVSTRDAVSAAARAAKAAKCRTLGASAARSAAAAAADASDPGRVRVEAFLAACQRRIREVEALVLKHAPFREPSGFEALGGEHYASVPAGTPPPFPRGAKPDAARFLRMARDKFQERVPLKGASESMKCASLFDPDRVGRVTCAGFRRAMASLGLDAIDEETVSRAFARVAEAAETATSRSTGHRNADAHSDVGVGTSAFVRAFLPPRVAVDRPARGAVLAALEKSEAATEAEVRAVLEACDVDVENPTRVARLVRLSRRDGKSETKTKLDYAKLAGMVSQPEPPVRKAASPTPAVDHCATEAVEIRDASPPSTPSFPPTPPFAAD